VAILASVFSLHSHYWFLPILFGCFVILAYNLKSIFLLDIGILSSILSLFFVNHGLYPNLLNLSSVIGFFFLFVGIWFYVRNLIYISGIEDNLVSEIGEVDSLVSFKRAVSIDISGRLFIAAFLAIVASLVGMYSPLGIDVSPMVEILLMVAFSSGIFFIVYFIIRALSIESSI